MSVRIKILETILDEMENGFIILKMNFGNDLLPDDFSIVEVNTPFEEISGVSLKEFTGMKFSAKKQELKFLDHNWLEEYSSLAVGQKFRNREKFLEESQTYVRIRTFIPQPGYLVLLVTDITPFRKNVKMNGTEEPRLRSLVENCKEGFLFLTSEGKILSVSANILEVLGYSEDELKVIPELGFFKVEDRIIVRKTLQEVLIHPRIASEIEFQVNQKDGSGRWFEGTLHNLLQVQGVCAIVMKLKEITRRKKEEFEFHQITMHLLRNYTI
jgi:PAS domain S-box-containing protein